MNDKGDLISREALKKDFEERNKACDKWIENAKDEETKIRADATKSFICEVIMTIDNTPTVEPFTQLEKEEIADAITYLLDAELLEENGYTEEVINALKSALKKVGGAE